MPTYEYACKSCGEHLEVVQSFTDDSLTICPNCAGELKKVFGSIGIVFKGSGFYKTDSRTPAKTGASRSEAASTKESSTGTDGATGDSPKSPAPADAKAGAKSSPSGSGAKAASGNGSAKPAESTKTGRSGSEKAAAAS
ncbi:MAG: FmdB family zinc ribbon protein [Acidimicrobiales bacterium]